MPIDVTMRLFSGQPGPRFGLTARLEREVLQRLAALPPTGFAVAPRHAASGYHGINLRADDGGGLREYVVFGGVVLGTSGAWLDADRAYERWLFEEVLRPDRLRLAIEAVAVDAMPVAFDEIAAPGEATNRIEGLEALGVPVVCAGALPVPPPPDSWQIYEQHNNCLNYALNMVSTLRWADLGHIPRGEPPCAALVRLIEQRGPRHLPGGFPAACSPDTYLILMCLVNPSGTSSNYHFLRSDRGGGWSHKFGAEAVTNHDDACVVMNNLADARFRPRLVACAVFEHDNGSSFSAPL